MASAAGRRHGPVVWKEADQVTMTAYVWKEWKEQSRGKGLWGSLIVVVLLSVLLLVESRRLPAEQGFQVFLLSLYELNVYLLPLFGLFSASFAVLQEKEQKTLPILLAKKESYAGFLLRKSIAVQVITLSVCVLWYFIFAVPMLSAFTFNLADLLRFQLAVVCLLAIFNQIGILLGSMGTTKMQLVGMNLLIWFTFIFLLDLAFLYTLPDVSNRNIFIFSLFYFLDPLHTLHFYLENALGFFPLGHLSKLMNQMVWLPPQLFLLADTVLWLTGAYGLAVLFGRKGDKG
jgi:ABC-2 type transport system permease protein